MSHQNHEDLSKAIGLLFGEGSNDENIGPMEALDRIYTEFPDTPENIVDQAINMEREGHHAGVDHASEIYTADEIIQGIRNNVEDLKSQSRDESSQIPG